MKVPALALDHPLAGRVDRSDTHELIERQDDDAELTVLIEAIKLSHEGDEKNFRPYVRIKGELLNIKPQRRLPGAVSEVTFAEGSGLSLDARCEFSDEQIVQMIQDGYFEPGYGFVDGVVGEQMILNAPTVFKISRAYEGERLDTPIVFVDVPDRTNLTYEPDMSGYDFTEYLKVPEKQLDLERVVEKSFDVEHDLFAELHEQFERENGPMPTFEASGPVVESGDEFDRRRREAAVEAEASAPRVEEPVSEETRLFRDHVEGALDQAIPSKVQAPVRGDSAGFDERGLSEEEAYYVDQEQARSMLSSTSIDLGAAGAALGVEAPPVRESEPVDRVEVAVDDEAWLFEDDDREQDHEAVATKESARESHELHEVEAGRPMTHGGSARVEAADPESSESQSRVAKLLAEHAERERVAQEARRAHVREQDIRPGS